MKCKGCSRVSNEMIENGSSMLFLSGSVDIGR